jgi:DNA polymerase IV
MVDFNSYFASVEQQLRPELRGKPVAVVPVLAETTCCIAASYEAKAFGIKTGTMVAKAKKMCRELIIVEARPPIYVEIHTKLVDAVETCVHVEKILSIDEMVCALTGKRQQREQAVALALEIKQTISNHVGSELRCSIGIAPNPFLAKTATDMQKPDGLVVIEQSELPDCLHRLALRDLCGIGSQMEKRLRAGGILTVRALCAASRQKLREIWGSVEGERMYSALRGEKMHHPAENKSVVGHSHVLSPEQRSEQNALPVIHRLLQKAATRLRRITHLAGGMELFLEFTGIGGWSESIRFQETADTLELTHALEELWQRRPMIEKPILMVGVTLFHLVDEKNATLRLLEGKPARRELNRLMDQINSKYGTNAIYFGGAHEALDSAPMRIAFRHVPEE